METTVTNQPEDKGAFASSMCGGVIYYTPDITQPNPRWREVFDDTTAAKDVNPLVGEGGGCDGGGWVQTSGDDRYLYHAVIGRSPGYGNAYLAFGHGHKGLAQAAITGRLIQQLADDEAVSVDLHPYRPDRFAILSSRAA